jgi:glycosyltransferase involved in cell wall biosynthesis
VGGCKERKGLPYLLNALDYTHKKGELDQKGIHLLILGKTNGKYQQLSSNIRRQITILPYVSEDFLPNVYRAADVFVMPSTSEGWGIALIEALACGTPVVSSRFVPSAFATKDTGVVCIEREMNNPKRLAQSILNLLDKENFVDKDWSKIFDSLVARYSWKKLSQLQVDIYEELMNKGFSHVD